MQEKLKKALKNSIFYIFFIVIVGIKLYYDSKAGNDIKEDIIKNSVISKCKVINASYYGKSNTLISYSYLVNGKEYQGEYITRDISSNIDKNIRGKMMPLIYSRKNPKNGTILVCYQDFKNYKLTYPDSLNWINDFKRKY